MTTAIILSAILIGLLFIWVGVYFNGEVDRLIKKNIKLEKRVDELEEEKEFIKELHSRWFDALISSDFESNNKFFALCDYLKVEFKEKEVKKSIKEKKLVVVKKK